MNLLEFKRRLMTDPGDRSPEMRRARASAEEFAEAARESDRFEALLQQALNVPVPHALAEDIILRQSLDKDARHSESRVRLWSQLAAVAAVLALAVALTTFMLLPGNSAVDVRQHVAWHWQHDGPQVLAASAGGLQADPDHVQLVLAEFGVELEPHLLAQVRLTKFCPTPDGAGAHIVLATEDGPVTLYYMPRTRLPSSPTSIPLEGGMEAVALNVERGSLAVIAEAGTDTPELARRIARQLAFAPGTTI